MIMVYGRYIDVSIDTYTYIYIYSVISIYIYIYIYTYLLWFYTNVHITGGCPALQLPSAEAAACPSTRAWSVRSCLCRGAPTAWWTRWWAMARCMCCPQVRWRWRGINMIIYHNQWIIYGESMDQLLKIEVL